MSGNGSPSPLLERHRRFAQEEAERTPVLGADERGGAASGRRRAVELEFLPYDLRDGAGADAQPLCSLLASYGSVEPEYAAIRRGAALFDATFRGTLLVAGEERRAFLQRMVTQDVAGLAPGKACRAFWLNRKGRIDADLVVAELGDRLVIDLDRTVAAATAQALATYVFSEDARFSDESGRFHRLELHGPASGRMLALAGAERIPSLDEACDASLGGVPVTLIRNDALGERGWSIVVPTDRAVEVWDALLAARDPHDERRRVRPIGWHAYNIARVEAGTPFFHIDFGPSNLPHESGVLRDRVSFKKGCYLGQEVVARMESLGKPKQRLVGLRPTEDLLPVAGAQVFARVESAAGDAESPSAGALGDQVGTVTSSTLAPMLGAAPIAFAMVRTSSSEPGTVVLVNAEGSSCPAVVGPLRSWPAPETPVASEGGAPGPAARKEGTP